MIDESKDLNLLNEFKKEMDSILSDLLSERQKVQTALRDKNYHASFVSRRINEDLKIIVKNNGDDHIKTMTALVQLIPRTIVECFDYLENLDENIGVALNAYTNAMSVYNKSNEKHDPDEKHGASEESKKINNEQEELKNSKKQSKIRKVGEKPKDKLRDRKINKKSISDNKDQDKEQSV